MTSEVPIRAPPRGGSQDDRRSSTRRDTITGRLLSQMSQDEQEAVWARRTTNLAEELRNQGREFDQATEARLQRAAARASLAMELSTEEAEEREQERERHAEGLSDALDLTDYLQWFQGRLSDQENVTYKMLHILDAKEFHTMVEQNPTLWYDLVRHLAESVSWADIELARLRDQGSTADDEILEITDKYTKEMNTMLRNRDRYRRKITEDRQTIVDLKKEVERLKARSTAVPTTEDEGEESDDSQDSFLRGDENALKVPGGQSAPQKRVRFESGRDRQDRSPTDQSSRSGTSTATGGNARPPPRVDTFEGDRDKYDEWMGKLLSQIEANPEYFQDREERKINYLIQSLSGSAYDLVKDQYGYAGRRNNPSLKLSGALKILDRAYYPVDVARSARAKLEQLTMGSNDSFHDFYPKFQAQANRLRLSEEHLVDELTKRLNSKFAGRILDGSASSYDDIIDRCYRMDSQLSMWNASNSSRRSEPKKTEGRASRSERSSGGSSNDTYDQNTVKLGEHSKPLEHMSIAELKKWKRTLPRGRLIVERIRADGRCLACQQLGHLRGDKSCVLRKLEDNGTSANTTFTTDTTATEQGKEDA